MSKTKVRMAAWAIHLIVTVRRSSSEWGVGSYRYMYVLGVHEGKYKESDKRTLPQARQRQEEQKCTRSPQSYSYRLLLPLAESEYTIYM